MSFPFGSRLVVSKATSARSVSSSRPSTSLTRTSSGTAL